MLACHQRGTVEKKTTARPPVPLLFPHLHLRRVTQGQCSAKHGAMHAKFLTHLFRTSLLQEHLQCGFLGCDLWLYGAGGSGERLLGLEGSANLKLV